MRAAAPAVAVYVIFLALLLLARTRITTPAPAKSLVRTVAGGYVAFLAIVVVFAPISRTAVLPLLRAAVPQGLALAALAFVVFYGLGKRS